MQPVESIQYPYPNQRKLFFAPNITSTKEEVLQWLVSLYKKPSPNELLRVLYAVPPFIRE